MPQLEEMVSKINPNYKEQSLQIYLDKDYDAGILSKKLEGL